MQEILVNLRQVPALHKKTENEKEDLVVESVLDAAYSELTMQEADELMDHLLNRLRTGMGILQVFADQDDIQEIMVNAKNAVYVEENGVMKKTGLEFADTEELEEMIRRIAASVHREFNEMNPILDARLPDGSRVNAVYRNVALDGPSLTIRRFGSRKITMAEMVRQGSLTDECATFLMDVMRQGYNIFISGGTSSGKTTFLNALCDVVADTLERVVVIEDSRELIMNQVENLVQMECHNANSAGRGQIGMDKLIRTSLRMRPDRIIVGEVRGEEVADMLQAMNTGHSSVSTGHGNSVRGMLRRMEAMYLMGADIPIDAIRAQIVEGIDICVHLARTQDGMRRVMEVQELVDYKDGNYVLNPIFTMDADGELKETGNGLVDPYRQVLAGGRHV